MMVIKGYFFEVLALFFLLCWALPAESFILINEFLADPPSGVIGDTNADGTRSSNHDEFIEIFNHGADTADMSGWQIWDATMARHIFPQSTLLEPYQFLVLWGGGVPSLNGITAQTASTGTLSLNNSGDRIVLMDAQNQIIDDILYGTEGGRGQSLVRQNEGDPSSGWIFHNQHEASQGVLYSPGTMTDGRVWPSQVLPWGAGEPIGSENHAAVPEPGTFVLFGLGALAMAKHRYGRSAVG